MIRSILNFMWKWVASPCRLRYKKCNSLLLVWLYKSVWIFCKYHFQKFCYSKIMLIITRHTCLESRELSYIFCIFPNCFAKSSAFSDMWTVLFGVIPLNLTVLQKKIRKFPRLDKLEEINHKVKSPCFYVEPINDAANFCDLV